MTGKDVVLDFRAEAGGLKALLHAHFEALGVSLVAPEDGIDGFEEGEISVIALGAGTVEPGDVAIGAGDEAVGAGSDVDDNFSGSFHGDALQRIFGIITLQRQAVICFGFRKKREKAKSKTRGAHGKRKRDSLHPQADAFAGAKAEEKFGLLRSE